MMRNIAILLNSYHNAGPSNVMRDIIKHLDTKVVHITLITLFCNNSGSYIQELRKMGIETIEFNFPNKKDALLKGSQALKKIVKQFRIDIIHSNSVITDLISVLSKCKVVRICTLHNNMFYNYYEYYGKYIGAFMIQLHLCVLKKIDTCVCCSKYIYNDLSKKLENLIIIRNGVEYKANHHIISRELLNISDNALVYIYVGKLISRKNVLWLAKQFEKYHNQDEYLLILGNGPDVNMFDSINDNHIRLCGFIDTPEAYLEISDVYVSASLAEGFSLSVLEALSFGMLLLLSDIPSHREVFELCEELYIGEMFQCVDTSSLKSALDSIRKRCKYTNRNEIKHNAQNIFSATTMASEYQDLYLSELKVLKSIHFF